MGFAARLVHAVAIAPKGSPNVGQEKHRGSEPAVPITFTCHMAALYWGLIALGRSEDDAVAIVGGFVRDSCSGCTRKPPHGTRGQEDFARVFLGKAEPCSRMQLVTRGKVGDLVVFGDLQKVEHTAVIVATGDKMLFRGFNNFGTFSDPMMAAGGSGIAVTKGYKPPPQNGFDDVERSFDELRREKRAPGYAFHRVPSDAFRDALKHYVDQLAVRAKATVARSGDDGSLTGSSLQRPTKD